MRKLFAVMLIAGTASANEISYRSLQSGSTGGGTPIHDHGIRGEGQVIAVLDTGVDYDNCYFAEVDGSRPPVNTGTPSGGLRSDNVNPARRKVIAYDFLYSCDQYPGASGCDDPNNPMAYDNQGHGTHAAAAALGDRGLTTAHDYADSIAPAAKLIVQDAGYTGGDNCSQRPGIGCPVAMTPILDQAYRQGARIHSNSWGDRQGTPLPLNPPTANYPQAARDIDAFVFSHPDLLVVFNVGNASVAARPPDSTLSAPGSAKNTLQVGGTRAPGREDDILASFTLSGPARDGRIKPDVVGPAYVLAGDTDGNVTTKNCTLSLQSGTSWSSPTVAGAAALVRQYYTDGFYPTGVATPANGFTPSAVLLKATIIAAARPIATRDTANGPIAALPVPSSEQGFGFPVLHDVLTFPGDRLKLRVADVPLAAGLAAGEESSTRIAVNAGARLKAVLVWTDPAGVVRAATDPTPELVNDLDLRIIDPSGNVLFGNDALHPGQADRINNVEVASVAAPATGTYTVRVSTNRIAQGPRQGYALIISGDIAEPLPAIGRARAVRH
ncbi:MAG TPA: S8 family serine peptidase [Thermoanaerobaculia bacterium]|nr:S8 family serine peptidase [Thermoanaerobaculia bacterium]